MDLVGLKISMYFWQFEDLKFDFFSGKHALGPLKPMQISLENSEKKITINFRNLFDIHETIGLRVLEMAFRLLSDFKVFWRTCPQAPLQICTSGSQKFPLPLELSRFQLVRRLDTWPSCFRNLHGLSFKHKLFGPNF